MTNIEKQEVERVCGKDFTKQDIPTFIRKRDEEDLKKILDYQKLSLGLIQKAIKRNKGYCQKCGNEVMGNEPSLCQWCI